MYDLMVIGAGPAGASAAITAAGAGARVLLLERGRLPRNRVCGEFVSAESLDLLGRLLHGSGEDLLHEAHRIGQARVFSDGLALAAPVDPPAASIARLDLDSALWQAALHIGVEAHQRVAVNSVAGQGPFRLVTSEAVFEGKAPVPFRSRISSQPVQASNAAIRPLERPRSHIGITGPPVDAYPVSSKYPTPCTRD